MEALYILTGVSNVLFIKEGDLTMSNAAINMSVRNVNNFFKIYFRLKMVNSQVLTEEFYVYHYYGYYILRVVS